MVTAIPRRHDHFPCLLFFLDPVHVDAILPYGKKIKIDWMFE